MFSVVVVVVVSAIAKGEVAEVDLSMAMASRRFSVLCTFSLFFLAVFLLCLSSSCTLVDAKKKETKSAVTARKEDVKYIKCGVCEEIVKQLSRQVKKKRDKIAPKKVWLSCMCSLVSFCSFLLQFSASIRQRERKRDLQGRSFTTTFQKEEEGDYVSSWILSKNPNLSSLAAS